jgi:phage shock protein E
MKIKHILTLGIIGAIAISCNLNTASDSNTSNFKNINEKEVEEFIDGQKGEYELIDVRTPQEVSSGYLKSTKHFINISGQDFASKISELNKEKTYIVYCRSGARSSSAAKYMVEQGFKIVYNLNGGMMSWKDAKYITR